MDIIMFTDTMFTQTIQIPQKSKSSFETIDVTGEAFIVLLDNFHFSVFFTVDLSTSFVNVSLYVSGLRLLSFSCDVFVSLSDDDKENEICHRLKNMLIEKNATENELEQKIKNATKLNNPISLYEKIDHTFCYDCYYFENLQNNTQINQICW